MEDELFKITNDTYEPYGGHLYYNQTFRKEEIFLKSFFIFLVLIMLFILINRGN